MHSTIFLATDGGLPRYIQSSPSFQRVDKNAPLLPYAMIKVIHSTCSKQGQTASFFFEFELLKDIEVPIGGLEILNDRGTIVHGKNTLEYGVSVPSRVLKGSRLRFRQNIDLEIAIGEYTFTIGLATINFNNYKNRFGYFVFRIR